MRSCRCIGEIPLHAKLKLMIIEANAHRRTNLMRDTQFCSIRSKARRKKAGRTVRGDDTASNGVVARKVTMDNKYAPATRATGRVNCEFGLRHDCTNTQPIPVIETMPIAKATSPL